MTNDIYELKLHEETTAGKFRVTRVPGGWIYYRGTGSTGGQKCAVFIPFDNEFQS